jgi:hypothetical protein
MATLHSSKTWQIEQLSYVIKLDQSKYRLSDDHCPFLLIGIESLN